MELAVLQKSSKKKLSLAPYQSAAFAIDGFSAGGRVVGLTKGQFSLIHLISETLKITGSANVIISTWSAGFYDSQEVRRLMDSGLILDVKIIVDRSFSTRQKNYALGIEQAFGLENIRTTNTHAKFVLIWNDNYKVCVRSSMNLNENKRCENFDMDDDAEIFDFYKRFCDEIFAEMPSGFVESRSIVDPVFELLMGGSDGVLKKTATPKNGFKIYNKNGNVIE